MTSHAPPCSAVVRLPAQPRLVPTPAGEALAKGGVKVGKSCVDSDLRALAAPNTAGGLILDALLSSDAIDPRQHAAGLVYRCTRRRWEEATRSCRHRAGGMVDGGLMLA